MENEEYKGAHPHETYDFFKKYKDNCDVFFETGSHNGDTIERALLLGYKKVISVELNPYRHTYCTGRFNKEIADGKVFLFLGNTIDCFNEMCSILCPEDRCFFWLDAHDEGGGEPAMQELEFIHKLNRKNDIILVDDMPLYYEHCIPEMKNLLKQINNDYKFSFDDIFSRGWQSILIAN